MTMRQVFTTIAVSVCCAVLGVAVIWTAQERLLGLRNPPQFAWAEFRRVDEMEPPVNLAGPSFHGLIEHMFYGFRTESAGCPISKTDATWTLMIGDVEGTIHHLSIQHREGADFWSIGTAEHAVDGDVGQLLAARRGFELLDLAAKHDWSLLESAIDVDGQAAIDPLIDIANSRFAMPRMAALRALNFILSARVRREAVDAHGMIGPDRVLEFPDAADHPRAAEVRGIALNIIEQWNAGKFPLSEGSWVSGPALSIVAELANGNTTDALAEMLRARADADDTAEELMKTLEVIYGLPPFVESGFGCGTGETAESRKRAEQEALARRRWRRALLLEWYDAHHDAPLTVRLELAVSAWEPIINERQTNDLFGYPLLVLNEFRPLLRQGVAVVPMLRTAQARVSDISHQASYEMLIALVTGRHDPVLISQLSDGDLIQRELARHITAVSSD